MSTDLTVPTAKELEAISPADRWALEEQLDSAQDTLREFNDDELRRWVEVEGKTQREIAKLVGRSPGRIGQRATRLGLTPHDSRGGSRLLTPKQNGEVLDAEIVDDEPPVRPKARRVSPEGAAHYLPDVVAPDADENLRTQALHWFEQGVRVKELLDKKRPLEPRSADDRKAIKREAAVMERVARRIKEATSG